MLLTDSRSIPTVFQSVSIKSPKVILGLFIELQKIAFPSPNFWDCWVPGHEVIPLNEIVDTIVKGVCNSGVLLNWISLEDLIQ